MITKSEIKNTIVTYWSPEDGEYLSESSMLPDVITGTGISPDESRQDFTEMLDNAYDEIRSNKLAGYKKAGRPTKDNVQFNTYVRARTKERISDLSKKFEISQGDTIDFLVFHFDCKEKEANHAPAIVTLVQQMNTIQMFMQQQNFYNNCYVNVTAQGYPSAAIAPIPAENFIQSGGENFWRQAFLSKEEREKLKVSK